MTKWKYCLSAAVLTCAASARAAEHPLAIDLEQSHVDIAVHATVDSFVAKLSHYTPQITVDDEGRITSVRFAFHFHDVATGKEKRDQAMNAWQETEKYAGGLFVLTALEKSADGTNQLNAAGQLTFHGMTEEIHFPVSILHQDTLYAIDGDATVDTREFGLPIIRVFGLLKVDPLVHVQFHLQGRLSQ